MSWHNQNGRGPFGSGATLLTSFPGPRKLIPGIGFASRLPPGEFDKLYGPPKYDLPKSVPNEPNLKEVAKEPETIRVSNKPEPTLQLGFGNVPDETDFNNIEDNEIEESEKKDKVNSNILDAFNHPVFKVKKDMFISGKGVKKKINIESAKKADKKHFLKIVKKMK